MPDFTAFLILAVPVAVGITKFVDLVRNAVDTNDTAPKVVWNILAFAAGIALCIGWSVNFTAAAGLQQSALSGIGGQILTGVVLGGMSSFWHEAMDAWSAKGHTPPTP